MDDIRKLSQTRYLGVTVTNNFKPLQHCAGEAFRAPEEPFRIKSVISFREGAVFGHAFVVIFGPYLKYCLYA